MPHFASALDSSSVASSASSEADSSATAVPPRVVLVGSDRDRTDQQAIKHSVARKDIASRSFRIVSGSRCKRRKGAHKMIPTHMNPTKRLRTAASTTRVEMSLIQ